MVPVRPMPFSERLSISGREVKSYLYTDNMGVAVGLKIDVLQLSHQDATDVFPFCCYPDKARNYLDTHQEYRDTKLYIQSVLVCFLYIVWLHVARNTESSIHRC